MNYEVKITSTGKPMKKLYLGGENGEVIEGVPSVNIFSDFPHYADIEKGSKIDGEIRKNDKGYDNLYSNEIKPRGGVYRPPQVAIKEAMEKKEASISHFQDTKEQSIKLASTIRMAVDIATSLTPEQWQSTTMQEEIRFWREWLWLEWDNTGKMPPF